MRKEIPGGETHNFYGDDAMDIEIQSVRREWGIYNGIRKNVPRDGGCINGRFMYTTKRKPLKAGHTRTEAYGAIEEG